jgi:hypothetical protein
LVMMIISDAALVMMIISDIALLMMIISDIELVISLLVTGNTCCPSQFVRGHSPNSADRYFFCYIRISLSE